MMMQHGVAVRRDEFVECPACAAKSGSPPLCASCLHNRTALHEQREATTKLRTALREIIGIALPPVQLTEDEAGEALYEAYKIAAKAFGLKRGLFAHQDIEFPEAAAARS